LEKYFLNLIKNQQIFEFVSGGMTATILF